VLFCLAGLFLLLWSLISFRKSFRIGIDTDHPDKLIVDGVFAFSRNPIYVAFVTVLIGEFLIFPNWISLIYLVAAAGLMHRQVLREEEYLKGHRCMPQPSSCSSVYRSRLARCGGSSRLRGVSDKSEASPSAIHLVTVIRAAPARLPLRLLLRKIRYPNEFWLAASIRRKHVP
jgi:hypothetical protein